MTDEERELKILEHGAKAESAFRNGANCCQAVLLAFQEVLGKDEDELMRIGSSFGAGVSGLRQICGSVIGMGAVYGMMCGYTKSEGSKVEQYKIVREMAQAYSDENGSYICEELLKGLPHGITPQERTEEYYKKRPCPKLCACAARIVARRLYEARE